MKASRFIRDQAAQLANEAGRGEILFTVDEAGTLLEVPSWAGLRLERPGRDVPGVLRDLADAMGPPVLNANEELLKAAADILKALPVIGTREKVVVELSVETVRKLRDAVAASVNR